MLMRSLSHVQLLVVPASSALVALLAVVLISLQWSSADAALACETDTECRALFGWQSKCLTGEEEGSSGARTCSSPFQRGCFQRLGTTPELRSITRICNSDDFTAFQAKHNFTPTDTSLTGEGARMSLWEQARTHDFMLESERRELKGLLLNHQGCRLSDFNYPEMRIYQADWESSVFLSWIYQVLLMEILEVPVAIGIKTGETATNSFYAPENTFPYGAETSYAAYAALDQATRQQRRWGHHDCLKTKKKCAHVLPDIWNTDFTPFIYNNSIEPPIANGQIARQSLYIPAHTAATYPDLAIFYGLEGEANRRKLADIFKRPTTWGDYCREVSSNNCTVYDNTTTVDDVTALRYPEDEDEAAMYYSEGLYQGYFRATEKNDCDINPNCTGHVVAPPCTWSIFLDAQIFWNNLVGLEISDGPNDFGRYNYGTIYEVWRAANATKSHVIVGWYSPELLLDEFAESDYAFQKVMLPSATDVCQTHRTTREERCSEDVWERRGDPLGACDNEAQGLLKVVAASVRNFNLDLDKAYQSPTYDFLKNVRITELEISRMFAKWLSYDNDRYGNDAREAVCSWMVDNYELLKWFSPPGYPRELSEQSQYESWWLILAQIFAVYVGFAALIGVGLCWHYRETKVMVFAQIEFLVLILLGMVMTCVGSALLAAEPTQKTCISLTWFLLMGYTVELVPVLVKTAAINTLVQSAKKQKRVNISRWNLLMYIFLCLALVAGFLVFWTLFDAIDRTENRRLVPGEENIVESDLRCTSNYPYFKFVAYGWEALLLLIGTVLAVQSRNVLKEFNESKTLGIMIYSHLMFMLLRGIFNVFYLSDMFSMAMVAALLSYNWTLDTLIAMCVYVLPKFIQAKFEPAPYKDSRVSSYVSGRVSSYPEDEDIKVLCCTANIGNAEPTMESMQAWIPLQGKRSLVTPLEDHDPDLKQGNFHLIVIGMQESTWKESTGRKSSMDELGHSKKELTEDEILNAMEDANTAALKDMIQKTLGVDYHMVAEDLRGQMRLFIFALVDIYDDIDTVRISGANTGIGGVMANKGGIVVTLNYKTTRLSFLSAHLAAHEGESYYKARCDNIETILTESRTYDLSSKLGASISSHHMFVMGDLNFRTKFKEEMTHEASVQKALNLIELKDYDALYEYDELIEGLRNGDLLLGFQTLPCLFPPTFKVEREAGFNYKRQRTPSYTDRILFKSAEGLKNNLDPLAYEACVGFETSDHKPIRAAFSIAPNELNGTPIKDVDVRIVFKNMRCRDLPAADSNGLSDPYLMFLWDSIDLRPEKKSFKDKIRKLVSGKSWPRTSVRDLTLHPDWKGERIALFARNVNITDEANLYVVAMDSDTITLADDFLGAIALNVRGLVEMQGGEKETTIEVDRVLERGGKYSGRFKCDIDVKLVTRKPSLNFSGYFSTRNMNSTEIGPPVALL
ncbi:72 kDa inositol polyphosphate 5-phosphatase [Seminavis robusta]|uniref:72 kDa inositol polyphosphate 5-phosphatase n=1 Tax=Seminavis robusta TaxID=568900 RepID=A0A9N8E473_9STRA|nr:72 kDa inositol polyphosphate 5-phosphatase [Seminavis robusta]|eukprot:Sro506_g156370.1 72 kDa inositol polyphosphate 5-phosphatase (1426) ;mRNA; r:46847-51319